MSGAGAAGFFGKVRTHGDFVVRRLPATFVTPWDAWLQRGMRAAQQRLGARWLRAYLNAPVWCFALGARVCGSNAWVGVLMPGVDRVGRHFPFTIAAPVDADDLLTWLRGAQAWFDGATDAALSTLRDDFALDRFDRVVEELARGSLGGSREGVVGGVLDGSVDGSRNGSLSGSPGGSRGGSPNGSLSDSPDGLRNGSPNGSPGAHAPIPWRLAPVEATGGAGGFTDAVAANATPGRAVWWNEASEASEPNEAAHSSLLASPGLPPPPCFASLLVPANSDAWPTRIALQRASPAPWR